MEYKILISGFGGQGMMNLGKILAKAALQQGKYSTFIPSYGAEMRGGTAHCFVKISDVPIASPFIEYPDIAVILNQPSLDKFKGKIKKGSLLISNADLVEKLPKLPKVTIVNLPLNKMAIDCGDKKVINTIALGIIIAFRPSLLKKEKVIETLKEVFKNKSMLDINLKGFFIGQNNVYRHE